MTKKKEDKIIRLLKKIRAVWEQEHPNQLLSMTIGVDYISAFSLDDNNQYIMSRTIINGTDICGTEVIGAAK